MLTSEEKRKWIIENCCDSLGKNIDLRWLDFSGYDVDLSHMKAREIRQIEHKAKIIYQGEHQAELITQNEHKAKEIYQSEHEAKEVYQNRHKAEQINQEHNYAKKLRTTDLKNYKKKINAFNKVYYELKEKK